MAGFRQTRSQSPVTSALQTGLRWLSRTLRYAGTWYIANGLWALLDLADRDPQGVRAWTDPDKLAGALVLRHFLLLIRTSPVLGTAVLILALAAGRALHELAQRIGNRRCTWELQQIEDDVSERVERDIWDKLRGELLPSPSKDEGPANE